MKMAVFGALAKHIEWVKSVCHGGGGVLDGGDTPVGPGSFEIALLAVGAASAAATRCWTAP